MIKKFDAWVEPWIPIEKTDGKEQTVSIYEALKDAHNIRAIRASIPSDTFGIARLLITILTDIYRPERWANIDDIRGSQQVNVEKLDDYYQTCTTEGSSFDIFDEKRPFLQYAFTEKDSYSTKNAANLFDHIPSGNNVPHFNHVAEDAHSFSPARCLQALCGIPFYEKHKRSKKVTTGINGIPPIYFLYNGDSLFDTLIVSMVPRYIYKESQFGLPIWRDANNFAREKVVNPTLLHGLFSSPLKVQLVPRSQSEITEIYITDDGVNYSDVQWKDPHVAYFERSGDSVSLKARNTRAVWRDLPIIIKPDALSFLYDWQYREITKEIMAFVKVTELKGTVFMPMTEFVEELKIPIEIMADELLREYYSSAVLLSDEVVRDCANALKKPVKTDNKNELNPYAETLPPIFTEVFLSKIKNVFDYTLIQKLVAIDTDLADWEKPINSFLTEQLRLAVNSAVNVSLGTISDENVDTMILKNTLRRRVYFRLNTILKKGGYIDGDKKSKQSRK